MRREHVSEASVSGMAHGKHSMEVASATSRVQTLPYRPLFGVPDELLSLHIRMLFHITSFPADYVGRTHRG